MFVFYFDIAAIMLSTIMIIINHGRKEMKNSAYYLFWALVILTIVTPVSDIISIKLVDVDNSKIIFEIVNDIFYLSQLYITLIFLQYILARVLVHMRKQRLKKFLLFIPGLLYMLAIFTNFFTHFVWTLDDVNHVYTHGPLFLAVIAIPFLYFLIAIVFLILFRKIYSKLVLVVIITAMAINVSFAIIEIVFPYIMMHSFGFSLTVILIFSCIKNQKAFVDSKTGIPNIYYYIDYVGTLLLAKKEFVVNFIRIADYELFISTYGFDTTQELMQKIGKSIQDEFKVGDIYSIDQNFYAFINTEPVKNIEIQNKIKGILDQNWRIADVETAFSYFIVGLHYPTDVKNFDDIISYGQYIQRMHRKRYGILPVSELSLRDTVREKTIEKCIEKAIENDYFEIFYQPIYSIKEKKFVTAEALIRMNIPGVGYISPAEFIPLSEKNGTIIKIGNSVMDKVFSFISSCDIRKYGLHYIELNLSTIQCLQRNFMDILYDCLKDYHVDPHQVCFEITETASNCAPDVFDKNLEDLRRGGYKIAIDDYGSGYSNIVRLIDSGFDILKFDKETVEQICLKPSFKEAFYNMLNVFHTMGSVIVAEGVETKEQYEYLKEANVDFIQGYYFSKPIPLEDFLKFLEKNNLDES